MSVEHDDDLVLHGFDDHDDNFGDDNATIQDPLALVDTPEFSDGPDSWVSEERHLAVSYLDMDYKDML